jgi:poly-gamma-glutamate synthesis protein (capsule biosynthesis protein)
VRLKRGGAVALVLAMAITACSQAKSPSRGQAGASGSTASASSAPPTSVRVVATGDMIAHDAILQEGKQADGSYAFDGMLTNMKPYFARADVRFCNEATPAGGPDFPIKGYPVFNAPIEWSRAIEGVGCNLINLGTNHTNDHGQPLIDAFRASWDGRPGVLAATGANRTQAEHDAIAYFTVNGVKFAFLTYLTYNNSQNGTAYGVNDYTTAGAKAQIAEARANADIIIVSMRWGTEDQPDVNSTQRQDALELADDGADIVLGHGPHSLQPVERLTGAGGRETIVWYSLGNFLNAQLPLSELIGGFAVMDIDVATKKVASIGFLPTFSHYTWTPAQQAAHDLLARHDFSMYALDKAGAVLGDVQDGSTVEDQTNALNVELNKDTKVAILTSEQYLQR